MTTSTLTLTRLLARTLSLLLLSLCVGCASLSRSPDISAPPEHYQPADGASDWQTLQTRDRLTLFSQWWEPAESPRAVVVFLHGTLVHSGFYAPWAEHLREHGYAVLGVDLRGWGQSQGYGRRAFIGDYDEYLLDLHSAWQHARQRYPELPLYLQGESMGGLISLLSQVEGRIDSDGLILNAPAVRPGMALGPLTLPYPLTLPGLWLAGLPGRAFPNMPGPIPGPLLELGAPLILNDKQYRQEFKDDPHSLHKALPFSYLSELHKASRRVQKGLDQVTVPTLIIQGDRDTLVPHPSSRFTYERLGSDDKTLNLYPGVLHASLHDRQRETIWADIIDWLDQRSGKDTETAGR